MIMQPGQTQSHPSRPYTGDTNRQLAVDNASSPNMYESVSSIGMTASAPAPAVANPQLSVGNYAHGYQQNVGAHYQSPQMISTSDVSRHDLVQDHIPQQNRQGFSTVTPSYPQPTNQANQSFPNAYYNASNSGAEQSVQTDSGNNAQFFHQQQYHEAPPIRSEWAPGSSGKMIKTSNRVFAESSQVYQGIRSVTDSPCPAAAVVVASSIVSSSVSSSQTSPSTSITTLSSSTTTMPSSSTRREAHRPVYDEFTVAVPDETKTSFCSISSDKREVYEIKRRTEIDVVLENCPVQFIKFAEHLRYSDPYDWEVAGKTEETKESFENRRDNWSATTTEGAKPSQSISAMAPVSRRKSEYMEPCNYCTNTIQTLRLHIRGRTGSKSSDPFLIRSQSNPNQHSTQVAWSSSADDLHSAHSSVAALSSSPNVSHLAASLESALPSYIQQSDVIASLPNCVVDSARRASLHDGASYLNLAKAPGDVSMSPNQLILCLSAASKKLSANIHRGIQLRITELKEAIDKGRISERCLKSLNYVVDAIDRGQYDDAQTFYDRLRTEFPSEMGPWAQQGIRLLISELRRPASRIGSAGMHIRSQ
ncbi:hypothetical protein GCK32_010234 [Trichostrongylus colubriformis]|uniref:Uncharacterized protein n=1 Tax=Trichostrongylus colubriformis TaxID=6319 RepID=A0AAN8F3W1_TRICO